MGILFSIFSAFSDSIRDVLLKQSSISQDSLSITWAWQLFSLVVYLPILLLVPLPSLNPAFYVASSIKILLHILALYLFVDAIKHDDISLTIPLLSLTPVFVIVTSFIINHELPSTGGVLGILLIIAGAYLLSSSKQEVNDSNLETSKSSQPPINKMLIVSVLWGITSALDKFATLNSNPWFYAAYTTIIITTILTALIAKRKPKGLMIILTPKNIKILLPAGVVGAISLILQMVAINLTVTAYVIAIKRSSIVISTLLAYVIFKEKIKKRLIPIMIMFLGILVMSFA